LQLLAKSINLPPVKNANHRPRRPHARSNRKRKQTPAVKRAELRPKPGGGRSRKRFITAAEARQLATRYVLNRMFRGAPVQDDAKVPWYVHNVRREDVWLVYKNQPELLLQSSDVVVVCKRTGRILYEGSANDEG
jgi:hypothetical protein